MSNDPEEFKDYEEPNIDNTIINNLIQSVFNPNLRNNMSFSEYLNSRDSRTSIWNDISNIDIWDEIENEIENDNQQEFNVSNNINFRNMRSSIWNEFNDDNEQNFGISDIIYNFISPIIVDPIDFIAEQSFEADQTDYPEKTDYNLIIESFEFSSLNDDIHNNNKECTICTVEYEKDCMVSITKCNHIFHTDCIKEWAKYKQICPMCRTEL